MRCIILSSHFFRYGFGTTNPFWSKFHWTCMHQTRQLSRTRTMLFSVPQQDRTTLCYLHFLGWLPLWPWSSFGGHPLQQLSGSRVAACSTTLSRGLDKISTACGHNSNPLFLFGKRSSGSFHGLRMYLIHFVFWTVMTHLTKFHKTRSRKLPLVCFWTTFKKQDFAGPLSRRASRVLGPISCHRVAHILLHMKIVSRSSRPRSLVGFLRILCNALCTPQNTIAHAVLDAQMNLTHTHYIECLRLCIIFVSFWRHAPTVPHRDHFLHDLITRVFLSTLSRFRASWKFW